jgi:hypothetical protein
MTRAERDKRYRDRHAVERAEKRKASKAERSDEQIQVDLARDRERKRLKKAKMSREELAASRQHASELSKQRKAALSLEDREALLARTRATELQLRLAKKHGPKAFCMDRAARYPTDSVQHANYTQLAQQGFFILRGACAAQAQDWLKAAQRVIATEQGESLFSGIDKHGKLRYSAKRKQYVPDAPLSADVVTTATQLLQQQLDEYTIVDPAILANGKVGAQPAHCDIRDQSHLWCEDPPLSGLIALEKDTKLLVMPASLENYNGELETIELEAGDVLIFHALLIHAGSAYSKTNRRLHFTALGHRSWRSRPINETYVV